MCCVGCVFDVSNLATWGICYILLVFSYCVISYIPGIVNFITCLVCNPILCLTKSIIIVVMIIRMKHNTIVVPMADGGEVFSSLLWHPSGAMSLMYAAFLKLHVLPGWC